MIEINHRYLRVEYGFIYTAYQLGKETALTFIAYGEWDKLH